MDQWVLNAQNWVNATYKSVSGFTPAPTDGQTGWSTMYALTRALQHELGITTLSDTFGPDTYSKLSALGDITPATSNKRIIALLQCGLWCKGYAGTAYTTTFGTWDSQTTASIGALRTDMGLSSTASVPAKVYKSILTMDAYVTLGGGTAAGTAIQRWMNGRYFGRADFYIIPCDGSFSRQVATGLIFAVQYEIGLADGVANGTFGPATQQGVRTYGVLAAGAADGARKMVSLFQAALIFNAYAAPFSGTFDSSTGSKTSSFQSFMGLSQTGAANYQTWAALLVSTGDTTRAASGADTATPLTAASAAALYSSGVRIVGRYLNGSTKRIVPGELSIIFAAGLKLLPIWEESDDTSTDFSFALGNAQGINGIVRMRQMGIQPGQMMFFTVDYDATADDIANAIVPHYEGIRNRFGTGHSFQYSFGVYGTRNVCASLVAAGLVSGTFASDLSTGYSGNLGFALPAGWHYDQFVTTTVGTGSSAVSIDRDSVSSRAVPVPSGAIKPVPTADTNDTSPGFNINGHWKFVELTYHAESFTPVGLSQAVANALLLNWLQKPTYWGAQSDLGIAWQVYTPIPEVQLGLPSASAALVADARSQFEAVASTIAIPNSPLIGGVVDHFAASTRAFLCWGMPAQGSSTVATSELGSWGLDLVQAWTDYETYRTSSLVRSTTRVGDWIRANVGVNYNAATPGENKGSAGFGRSDLLADLAAYEMARQMTVDPTRSADDVFRAVLVATQASSAFLGANFVQQRFGGPAKRSLFVAAITNLWTSSWASGIGLSRSAILHNVRAPGSASGTYVPNSSILSTEVADMAGAFADVVINFS